MLDFSSNFQILSPFVVFVKPCHNWLTWHCTVCQSLHSLRHCTLPLSSCFVALMLAITAFPERVKINHSTILEGYSSCIGVEFNQQQQWLFLADASVTASTASDPLWLLVVSSNFDGKLSLLCRINGYHSAHAPLCLINHSSLCLLSCRHISAFDVPQQI